MILVCFCLLTITITAFASDAGIKDMILGNTRDNVLLFLKVEGAFTDKIRQAVLNGIPTTFSFYIKVKKVRTFWPDTTVAEIKVTHSIKYDPLKKRFTVKRSWENNRVLTTSSFDKARKWMSEIQSLPIVRVDQLIKDARYKVYAKAEMDKVRLPFYLNYILFFSSLWNFETDWQSIEFKG